MICRHCAARAEDVKTLLALPDCTLYGCTICGLVWLARKMPFKTQPPATE